MSRLGATKPSDGATKKKPVLIKRKSGRADPEAAPPASGGTAADGPNDAPEDAPDPSNLGASTNDFSIGLHADDDIDDLDFGEGASTSVLQHALPAVLAAPR